MRPDESAELAPVFGMSTASALIQPCCRAVYYEAVPFEVARTVRSVLRLALAEDYPSCRPIPGQFTPISAEFWVESSRLTRSSNETHVR